ncbi:hypothetical protein HPB51_026488 [Rhipicephalus microplus]|uniref:P-type domain-containing protein n=1 Tax=Rhipicephalus microplus TaxID=6941 RepID=A0A9J6D306_RHIMP|nr:hypothetical protein HPB51_026488 [Rhipicephalus microplus]
MECRASRRNVEDANQGDIFQEVRLDDNGNMEEAPITGSVDVVYAPFWRQVSGRGAAHPDGGDVLVRRRHAAVVVRHPGVALLHHVGGRPFSPRDKPLPKPEPTMTIKLRVADLPESLLGALRQRGAAGSGLGNGSAASAAAASDPSRGRGDGRRHSPAAPPLLAGSDHRAAVQRPGEPMMSAQMYGDSALAEEGYSNIGRVGPGSSRGDVKEIVVIQSPICGQVWESQRIDCHPEAAPSLESCRVRGCCFEPVNASSENLEPGFQLPPACFYPANYLGYKVDSIQRSRRESWRVPYASHHPGFRTTCEPSRWK